MYRDVYSGFLKLLGEEQPATLSAANNYVNSLIQLDRFEEAKTLSLKIMPVARRALGKSHALALKMRSTYAMALYYNKDATLDDLREAVTTLEETERTAKRVLGGTHPVTVDIQSVLQNARAELHARETPPSEGNA